MEDYSTSDVTAAAFWVDCKSKLPKCMRLDEDYWTVFEHIRNTV